jgi:hypothetical protein
MGLSVSSMSNVFLTKKDINNIYFEIIIDNNKNEQKSSSINIPKKKLEVIKEECEVISL